MMNLLCFLVWFALTKSITNGKPLSLRMKRSSENDQFPQTIDESANRQLNSFQLPNWLHFYKTFLENIADDTVLPEMKETKIEVSGISPQETTLENNFETPQSEDVGDLNILRGGTKSDWEINNIIPELGTRVGDLETIERPKVNHEVFDDVDVDTNYDGTPEPGENKLNEANLLYIFGMPWGMIQELRDGVEDIYNYETDILEETVSNGENGEFFVQGIDGDVKDNFETPSGDDIVTFNDIQEMLNDDNFHNVLDIEPLGDASDIRENALDVELPNDDVDRSIEVGGMELPTGKVDSGELYDSDGSLGDPLEIEGIESPREIDNSFVDSTIELPETENPSDDFSSSEMVEVENPVDNTLEIGDIEVSANGIELPEANSALDSTNEVGGIEFPEGELTDAAPELSDDKQGSSETPSDDTVVSTDEANTENNIELPNTESVFDSNSPVINDEAKFEIKGVSDDSNFDTPSVEAAAIEFPKLNDDNKHGLPLVNDDPISDSGMDSFSPEMQSRLDDLMNDEPVT